MIPALNTSFNSYNGTYEVSSFSANHANTAAVFELPLGTIGQNPQAAPFWPFGPGEQTNGVYTASGPYGGYFNDIYAGFLTGTPSVFPDSQANMNDWPSFPVGFYNPVNFWGVDTVAGVNS